MVRARPKTELEKLGGNRPGTALYRQALKRKVIPRHRAGPGWEGASQSVARGKNLLLRQLHNLPEFRDLPYHLHENIIKLAVQGQRPNSAYPTRNRTGFAEFGAEGLQRSRPGNTANNAWSSKRYSLPLIPACFKKILKLYTDKSMMSNSVKRRMKLADIILKDCAPLDIYPIEHGNPSEVHAAHKRMYQNLQNMTMSKRYQNALFTSWADATKMPLRNTNAIIRKYYEDMGAVGRYFYVKSLMPENSRNWGPRRSNRVNEQGILKESYHEAPNVLPRRKAG